MLIGLLRQVAIVLTGLAFLGGGTIQALPPSDLLSPPMQDAMDAMTTMADCPHVRMPQSHMPAPIGPMPCKGMTLDCMKWMGCIGFPSLPTPVGQASAPVEYGPVAYWSAVWLGDGVSIKPDLLPPIGV